MTRICDRYARLDSTYTMNQPHDAARALEMILPSTSGRSERACNIHSKCQCHPVVHGREKTYHILPLTSYQCLWEFATSESRACQQCSQQKTPRILISCVSVGSQEPRTRCLVRPVQGRTQRLLRNCAASSNNRGPR